MAKAQTDQDIIYTAPAVRISNEDAFVLPLASVVTSIDSLAQRFDVSGRKEWENEAQAYRASDLLNLAATLKGVATEAMRSGGNWAPNRSLDTDIATLVSKRDALLKIIAGVASQFGGKDARAFLSRKEAGPVDLELGILLSHLDRAISFKPGYIEKSWK